MRTVKTKGKTYTFQSVPSAMGRPSKARSAKKTTLSAPLSRYDQMVASSKAKQMAQMPSKKPLIGRSRLQMANRMRNARVAKKMGM